MELHNTEILLRPLVSEKSTVLADHRNAYSFAVDRRADKLQIKSAVEAIYNVKVLDVRTSRVPGKPRRTKTGHSTTPEWKKAVVVVSPEQKIEIV